MRAIVNTGPGKLEWLEWPTPEPGPGQVRIRTGACGICATDLEMIAGWDRTGFPAIPGHEWSGTIDTVGEGVDAALVGKRCVAENVLSDGGEVGFEHPGGYAEHVLSEALNVQVLPDDFSFSTAALIEPLAVCVRGFRRLRYQGESPVIILGDGPIGLIFAMLSIRAGVGDVTLVGGRSRRLALARSLGVARTIDYHALKGGLAEALRAECDREFPVVVEATGSDDAMGAAMALAAREGKVLVLGDYGKACAGFRWVDLLHRELELIGSNASAGAWPEAVALATSGCLPLGSLVTHTFPAERFEEGMAVVRNRQSEAIKMILEWA